MITNVKMNASMANQITTRILPKTGTSVTKFYDDFGALLSKTVILGKGNIISKGTKAFITSFTHGKVGISTRCYNCSLGGGNYILEATRIISDLKDKLVPDRIAFIKP
ncbi:MAG: hypothetical protein WCY19_08895 [Candidatus Gastranaerophilaceae bacterium]